MKPMLDVNYKPPDEQTPPLAGGHWQRNYENMGIMPSQKNVTRMRLIANFENLKRKIDWLLVMEGIYGSEAEADEERPTEEGETDERDLSSVRLHFPRHTRTLPPLPKGNTRHRIPQE